MWRYVTPAVEIHANILRTSPSVQSAWMLDGQARITLRTVCRVSLYTIPSLAAKCASFVSSSVAALVLLANILVPQSQAAFLVLNPGPPEYCRSFLAKRKVL